jgi:hypothetical protein
LTVGSQRGSRPAVLSASGVMPLPLPLLELPPLLPNPRASSLPATALFFLGARGVSPSAPKRRRRRFFLPLCPPSPLPQHFPPHPPPSARLCHSILLPSGSLGCFNASDASASPRSPPGGVVLQARAAAARRRLPGGNSHRALWTRGVLGIVVPRLTGRGLYCTGTVEQDCCRYGAEPRRPSLAGRSQKRLSQNETPTPGAQSPFPVPPRSEKAESTSQGGRTLLWEAQEWAETRAKARSWGSARPAVCRSHAPGLWQRCTLFPGSKGFGQPGATWRPLISRHEVCAPPGDGASMGTRRQAPGTLGIPTHRAASLCKPGSPKPQDFHYNQTYCSRITKNT